MAGLYSSSSFRRQAQQRAAAPPPRPVPDLMADLEEAIAKAKVARDAAALERERTSGAAQPECDGLCVTADDIGVDGHPGVVAYPHPSCPLHAPGEVCQCGSPDRCVSPTHAPGGAS